MQAPDDKKIAIIGAGHVGLPFAVARTKKNCMVGSVHCRTLLKSFEHGDEASTGMARARVAGER